MSKLWGKDDLEAAWIDLQDANAGLRWRVGRPAYQRRGEVGWSQHAFNPRERPQTGRRTQEVTAVGRTEVDCVRAMAGHLRDIGESANAWRYRSMPGVARRARRRQQSAKGP